MKLLNVKLAWVLSALCISTAAIAQDNTLNIVSTAVPFLRITADARGGAMGDAGIATNPDNNSHYWNIAKVPFIKDRYSGIGLTYTPWLQALGLNDVYYATASGFYKLDDEGKNALSGGIRFFNLGSIQFTDNSGNMLNTYRPREYSVDFGWSRKLSNKNSLGIGLKYISSDLAYGNLNGVDYKVGTSVAGDIHFYHHGLNSLGEGWNYGFTLSNLGAKIGYTNDDQNKDFIPANLGLGVAYTKAFDESNKMTFTLDLNKLLVPSAPKALPYVNPNSDTVLLNQQRLADYRNQSVTSSWFKSFNDGTPLMNSFNASLGVEYSYDDILFLRAGYFYEDKTRGNRQFFTAGFGLKYNLIGFNFSYIAPSGSGVTQNPLSNTLRFGILFDFETAAEETTSSNKN